MEKRKKPGRGPDNSYIVRQFNKDGSLFAEHMSLDDACQKTGLTRKQIQIGFYYIPQCPVRGFVWRKGNQGFDEVIPTTHHRHPRF